MKKPLFVELLHELSNLLNCPAGIETGRFSARGVEFELSHGEQAPHSWIDLVIDVALIEPDNTQDALSQFQDALLANHHVFKETPGAVSFGLKREPLTLTLRHRLYGDFIQARDITSYLYDYAEKQSIRMGPN